jgi:hypothetical protein
MRYRYGISKQQYDILHMKQGGACAICRATKGGQHKNHAQLCVDHDHDTGVIRGLLCVRCNLLVGKASDNIALLRATIVYLERVGLDSLGYGERSDLDVDGAVVNAPCEASAGKLSRSRVRNAA